MTRRPASAPGGPADADRALARRFAAREPDSMRELYARWAGAVLTLALGRLADPHLVEEAVQDTFVKAWRAAASFEPERDLGPWLYAIARRTITDIARQEGRRPAITPLPSAIVAEDATTFDQAWETWEVRRTVRDLPAEERELLRLTHYVGLSQSQIAAQLGLPVGTVKSRTHRLHRRLAELLAHLQAW